MIPLAHPDIEWDARHAPEGGDAHQSTAAAEVVRADGTQVTLRSTRPFPPGAPVEGVLHSATGRKTFTLKIAGSRKVAEDVWEVRGRLLTATSDVRAAFAAVSARTTP
jgi:hypothetical protein